MSTENIDDSFNDTRVVRTAPATRDEILSYLRWRQQVEVATVKGARLKTQAIAGPAAIALFNRDGSALYKLGYTLTKQTIGPDKDRWLVTKWEMVPQKVIVQREESRAMSRATDADIEIPRPEGMEYFPFQKAGIAYAITRRATLFGDEPGLGKTCQAIGVINCTPAARRIFIGCPASLKLNWRRELEMWLVRKRPILIGGPRVFTAMADGIVILNYDNFHRHRDAIRDVEWDLIILDEAHYEKNPKSKRARVIFGERASREERAAGMADLPPVQAKIKLLLTGTPICNRPKELYPLIEFLDPIKWSSKWKYYSRYCGACQENGWDTSGASNLDELQDILRRSIMVRRLKKDVLTELPPKTRRVVEFAPTGEIQSLIREERARFPTEADYEKAVEQLSSGRVIGDRPTYRKNCAIAKAQMPDVLAYMDDAVEESGKVIIFIWHREVYRLLRQHFGPRAVGMMGDTPQAERQAAVDAFQNSPAIQVIIGQIITMGTGLTLTASSRVIMFELDDVPGNVSQAEDRAHRIGQRDNVLVEHLIVTGTIDARMAKNCISKQEIIDKALDKTDQPVPKAIPNQIPMKLSEPCPVSTDQQTLQLSF